MSIFFEDFYRLLSFKNQNFFPLKRFFFTKLIFFLKTDKIISKTQKIPQKLGSSALVRTSNFFEPGTKTRFRTRTKFGPMPNLHTCARCTFRRPPQVSEIIRFDPTHEIVHCALLGQVDKMR